MIQTEKSQVKRKEWEEQNQCDIRQPQPLICILPNNTFIIYGTTFRTILFIPRFSVSLNLFYRSQKPKKNYCTGDKPRGASPGREYEDGISTNNLVLNILWSRV